MSSDDLLVGVSYLLPQRIPKERFLLAESPSYSISGQHTKLDIEVVTEGHRGFGDRSVRNPETQKQQNKIASLVTPIL